MPWRAAARLYGPFGLPEADLAAPVGRVLSWLAPLLPAMLMARTWLTLNVVALIIQLASDGFGPFVTTLYQGGAITMVVGPFGVLLAVAGLTAAAAPGHRRTAIRQLARPVALAAITLIVSVAVFGLQLPGVRQALQGLIEPIRQAATEPPLSLAAPVVAAWLLVFGLCALYLIHHHTFGGQGHTLLDPLVSIWLTWTVGAVEIAMLDPNHTAHTPFITATLTGASLATLISAAELATLHRGGTTFRHGPWHRAQPEGRPAGGIDGSGHCDGGSGVVLPRATARRVLRRPKP
jgi:hypothetical protein